MATSHDHMQFVNLRRLALARAAFALLAGADEQDPVLKVMNAEPGCRAAAGLTAAQEASMLAAINADQFSAQAAADVVSDIIATNHADDELAGAATRMDLIRTLRRVEREARIDEDHAAAVLTGTSIEAKHAAAAQAIFALRRINKLIGPVLDLLDVMVPQEYRADAYSANFSEAAE